MKCKLNYKTRQRHWLWPALFSCRRKYTTYLYGFYLVISERCQLHIHLASVTLALIQLSPCYLLIQILNWQNDNKPCVQKYCFLQCVSRIDFSDKNDDASVNKTVKPAEQMTPFKKGQDVSGGNVKLTDLVTMTIQLDRIHRWFISHSYETGWTHTHTQSEQNSNSGPCEPRN